jgi:hypothetical protein
MSGAKYHGSIKAPGEARFRALNRMNWCLRSASSHAYMSALAGELVLGSQL